MRENIGALSVIMSSMPNLLRRFDFANRKRLWISISVILILALIFPMIYAVYIMISPSSTEDPVSPTKHYETGMAYLDSEDYQSAFTEFSLAILGDPEYVAAYYELGRIYLLAGQPSLACANLTYVVQQEPKNNEAL